jgi:hypothetical protein
MIKLFEKLMAKKKKSQIITVDLKAPNVSHTAVIPAEVTAPLEIKRVKYNRIEVIEILNDGKETATDYHCRLENGTTMHVPKSLFNV